MRTIFATFMYFNVLCEAIPRNTTHSQRASVPEGYILTSIQEMIGKTIPQLIIVLTFSCYLLSVKYVNILSGGRQYLVCCWLLSLRNEVAMKAKPVMSYTKCLFYSATNEKACKQYNSVEFYKTICFTRLPTSSEVCLKMRND